MQKDEIRKKLQYLIDDALRVYRFDAWENSDRIVNHLVAHGVTILGHNEYIGRWIPGSEPPQASPGDPIGISDTVYTVRVLKRDDGTVVWFLDTDSTKKGKWRSGLSVDYWTAFPEPPKEVE